MKYILELSPTIPTGRNKLASKSQLEEYNLTALTYMHSYRFFIRELKRDGASRAQVDKCIADYDISRSAALALGMDVSGLPKHLKHRVGGLN